MASKKLGAKNLQAAMNQQLDNLQAGRKPKALPNSSQIKSSPSAFAMFKREVSRGFLKSYFDMATFILKNALFPVTLFREGYQAVFKDGYHHMPALRAIASMAVYLYFSGGSVANAKNGGFVSPLRMKIFLLWIAHLASSAYITRQQFLADKEEEQLPKIKEMYREFRRKSLKRNVVIME
jgi:hypothetical protein